MVRQSISVQRYPARNGFSKVIGKHEGVRGKGSGKPVPKLWYFLDCDQREACRRAEWLRSEWRRLRALGHSTWPKTFVLPWDASQPIVAAEPTPWHAPSALTSTAGHAMPKPSVRTVKVGQVTVKDAFDAFRGAKEAEAKAGEISPARVANARLSVQRTVDRLGGSTAMANLDGPALRALVDHFRSRPKSEKTGEAISIEYAETLIANARAFFAWSGKAKLGWSVPDDFSEIFADAPIKPKTEAERKRAYEESRGRAVVETIDLETLRKFYKASDALMRAWMLCGLNAAFRQQEISELRAYYLQEEGGEWFFDYNRSKTGEAGLCVLWPETIAAIQATRSKPNELERVWLRPNGKPLVTSSEKGSRDDCIGRIWRKKLRPSIAGATANFDELRSTSATMIYRLCLNAGLSESQAVGIQEGHTAHSKEKAGMARHYSEREWRDVNDWQRKMRDAFAPVWS